MADKPLIHFANEVSRLHPELMRQFLKRQTREIARGNISLPQTLVLDILKESGPMRMGSLAKYLSVSMAATTGIVDKLVKSGYVIRSSSKHDRRIVNISITLPGKKISEKYNQARLKAIIDIFGKLSISDRNKYLEILNKLHLYLRESRE